MLLSLLEVVTGFLEAGVRYQVFTLINYTRLTPYLFSYHCR